MPAELRHGLHLSFLSKRGDERPSDWVFREGDAG